VEGEEEQGCAVEGDMGGDGWHPCGGGLRDNLRREGNLLVGGGVGRGAVPAWAEKLGESGGGRGEFVEGGWGGRKRKGSSRQKGEGPTLEDAWGGVRISPGKRECINRE